MADERVPVLATKRVLGDDQVGPEATDLPHDVAPQVEAGSQVAVRVAEVHDLGDSQLVRRSTLLRLAGGGQLGRGDRGILGPLAAVGRDHVVDPRARGRQQGDRGGRAELGVVGVAEDHEGSVERGDQLFAFKFGHLLFAS